MVKTIIFGNGVNDLLFGRQTKNINEYIYEKLKIYMEVLRKECSGLVIIDDFMEYVSIFNEDSFEEKLTFDAIYTKVFEYESTDYDVSESFKFRLQDMLKSILNAWLIEEFDIHNKEPTSEKILKMIDSFKNKLTINYSAPAFLKGKGVKFLHGSFNEEDEIRKHEIRTIKNGVACEIWIEKWDAFFQNLPYVHLSNKYGVGEMKNIDILSEYRDSDEESERLNLYEATNKISEFAGYKTIKPRTLQMEDYESYEKSIPLSDVIVLFGINPSLDEHLIEVSSKKSKRLIFVWYTIEDKKSAQAIINRQKDKLVNTVDFLSQYYSNDLLRGNFKHTQTK